MPAVAKIEGPASLQSLKYPGITGPWTKYMYCAHWQVAGRDLGGGKWQCKVRCIRQLDVYVSKPRGLPLTSTKVTAWAAVTALERNRPWAAPGVSTAWSATPVPCSLSLDSPLVSPNCDQELAQPVLQVKTRNTR